MTAPLKKRAVRFKTLEIQTGTDTTPEWIKVRGLTTVQLTIEPNEVDTSDFDSEGWADSLTTFRNWSISVEGWEGYTDDAGSVVEDPGQAAVKAKGLTTGAESYANVRLYRTDNGQGYEGRVSVNYNGTGGEVKGVEPFNCALTGSGVLTPYDNSAA